MRTLGFVMMCAALLMQEIVGAKRRAICAFMPPDGETIRAVLMVVRVAERMQAGRDDERENTGE